MAKQEYKKIYESKAVWAGIVATLLAILSALGYAPDHSLVQVIIAIATLFGVYGRVSATKILK